MFTAVAQATTIPIVAELLHHSLTEEINRIRADVDLPPILDWNAWLSGPVLNLGTWPEWFVDSATNWPVDVLQAGFVNNDDAECGSIPETVQTMLDSNNAPILITGGTGAFMGSRFYTTSAQACSLLKTQGILVTPCQELIPKELPEGIRHFHALPFASIMPQVKAVIHHGGTSTLARAMSAGVPQLALAFGGDRPDTAARLQRLGVAEYLPPPQWQPALIAAALTRITSSVTIKRCRELANCVRKDRSVIIACEAIENISADADILHPNNEKIKRVKQYIGKGNNRANIPIVESQKRADGLKRQGNRNNRGMLKNLSSEKKALLTLRLSTKDR
jgi:UDP:flavonoid glycosyltransferase YjiC (YdhE family)